MVRRVLRIAVLGSAGRVRRDGRRYRNKSPSNRRPATRPGDNTIEVVAYNASNLLASLPARTTIKFTGSTDTVKPTLYVLAIGINAYVDKGWRPVGRKIGIRKPVSLMTLNSISLLLVQQLAGEVHVSVFAVGDCGGVEHYVAGLTGSIKG
jgi:hypothetical protein